jgi:hypothetical protein
MGAGASVYPLEAEQYPLEVEQKRSTEKEERRRRVARAAQRQLDAERADRERHRSKHDRHPERAVAKDEARKKDRKPKIQSSLSDRDRHRHTESEAERHYRRQKSEHADAREYARERDESRQLDSHRTPDRRQDRDAERHAPTKHDSRTGPVRRAHPHQNPAPPKSVLRVHGHSHYNYHASCGTAAPKRVQLIGVSQQREFEVSTKMKPLAPWLLMHKARRVVAPCETYSTYRSYWSTELLLSSTWPIIDPPAAVRVSERLKGGTSPPVTASILKGGDSSPRLDAPAESLLEPFEQSRKLNIAAVQATS